MILVPPPGYTQFRPGQRETIEWLLNSPAPVLGLCAPTGTGKSLIYMTAALATKGRWLVLTQTKSLQDQLEREFGGVCVSIKGADNYVCDIDRRETAATAVCQHGQACPRKTDGGCAYYDKIRDALASRIVVTNYAKWLAVRRFAPTQLGQFDTIVCDEGHNAPRALEKSFELTLDRSILRHAKGAQWPPRDDLAHQRRWLRVIGAHLRTAGGDKEPPDERLIRLGDASLYVSQDEREYVYQSTADGHRLRWTPLDVRQFKSTLLPPPTASILLSATMDHAVLDSLGAVPYDWKETPHLFAKERRPIRYVPTASVRYGTSEEEYKHWAARIDEIVQPRINAGRKGILHLNSFRLLKTWLRLTTIPRGAIATHYAASERDAVRIADAVKEYIRDPNKMVLASPSASEGLDFPDNAARWQIIGKLPFPSKGDRVVERRMGLNRRYLDMVCARAIVQMAGRIVRHERDWGETFIVDDCWQTFRNRAWDLLPEYFREAVSTSYVLTMIRAFGE